MNNKIQVRGNIIPIIIILIGVASLCAGLFEGFRPFSRYTTDATIISIQGGGHFHLGTPPAEKHHRNL